MSVDPDLLRLMVYEVTVQARFALYRLEEADQIEQRLTDLPAPLGPLFQGSEEERILLIRQQWDLYERKHLAAHDFLMHVANVSKIFFPVLPKNQTDEQLRPAVRRRKHRGEALRELLDVSDTMEISRRQLRDHIEHFDERLDEWIFDGQGLDVIDFNRTLWGMSSPTHPPADRWLRNFDAEGRYTFLSATFDLEKARGELTHLYEKAWAWLVSS